MASPLGLGWWARYHARQRAKRAALLGYRNRGVVHYTQSSPARWQGINRRLRGKRGQYPRFADCSSFTTWCLWDATADRGLGDFVNGHGWRAGYTGTQVTRGKRVSKPSLVGDLVFYGGSASVPAHVAIYVGNGLVVSHGSESGPLLLRWNYRRVNQVRRYIR